MTYSLHIIAILSLLMVTATLGQAAQASQGQQKYGILQTLRPSALSPLALPCSLLVAY